MNPTTCVVCREGPVAKLLAPTYAKEMADIISKDGDEGRNTKAYRDCESKRQRVVTQANEYDKHVIDMATARVEAYKIRDKMDVGEVFVTRDYVNHHDHDGGHVKCLIFVLEWREVSLGPMHLLKIRHYCSDPDTMTSNFGYTIDVWHFQLHEKVEGLYPGLFDKYHTIHVGGDHGGHFSSAGLMIEESRFFRLYGKVINLCFFPSHHAHGRADAAGAEDKRGAATDKKAKRMRMTAESYTRMTNASNDRRSIAFNMVEIRRTADAYTNKAARAPARELIKWNQVSYQFQNSSIETEGVVKHRRVSGQGPWIFQDLLKRDKNVPPICQICSRATDSVERHTKDECKETLINPAEGVDCNSFSRQHVVLENRTGPKHKTNQKAANQKRKARVQLLYIIATSQVLAHRT